MDIRHYIVATAGHVDHGKSALVIALTGVDPDRLPEEKSRGMTIDLGFAHLKLTDPTSGDSTIHAGLVDVPGHKDFVKTMAAGVSSADAVLLVVAADDGWMPQTTEHVEILTYLGVKRAVVALTKIDLAGDQEESIAAVRERLKCTPFTDAPIVPTSVISGRGLAELKSALFKMLKSSPTAKDLGKPRLFVDRVFSLKGVGTIVTGTLTGGLLLDAQQVIIQPQGQLTRVRSIESHNQNVKHSGPGHRTALNLSNLSSRGSQRFKGVRRGDVVTTENLGEASLIVNTLLLRVSEGHNKTRQPLKNATRVRIHHGSANIPARISFLDSTELLPGQQRLAQLRLESPMHAFEGDRFVVRDWSQTATIAGGFILEINASRVGFKSLSQKEFLAKRALKTVCAETWLLALIERDKVIERDGALFLTHFSNEDVQAAVDKASKEKKILVLGGLVIDHCWWADLLEDTAHMIDEQHTNHPEQWGLKLTALKDATSASCPTDKLFDLLISSLCKKDFSRHDNVVRRASHSPSLPDHLQAASEALLCQLEQQPLNPPSKPNLVNDELGWQALSFLLEAGRVVEINDKMIMSAPAFAGAQESITALLSRQGSATVSEIRTELGTSRRIAIPLLEKLDRDGVTSRDGPTRTLK